MGDLHERSALPGAAFAALGGTAAPFFAWAWNNESQIKECELAHTGVTYTEINGIIVSCSPQS